MIIGIIYLFSSFLLWENWRYPKSCGAFGLHFWYLNKQNSGLLTRASAFGRSIGCNRCDQEYIIIYHFLPEINIRLIRWFYLFLPFTFRNIVGNLRWWIALPCPPSPPVTSNKKGNLDICVNKSWQTKNSVSPTKSVICCDRVKLIYEENLI